MRLALILLLGLCAPASADRYEDDVRALNKISEDYRVLAHEALPLIDRVTALPRGYGKTVALEQARSLRSEPLAALAELDKKLLLLRRGYSALKLSVGETYGPEVRRRQLADPGSSGPGLVAFTRAETAYKGASETHMAIAVCLAFEKERFHRLEKATEGKASRRRLLAAGVGAAALLIAATAMMGWRKTPPKKPPPPSYEIIDLRPK
ncbi:MAG: hypothetical protein HYZ75_01520 [Elusimicrobia bacterium]|nr:hypothetical protein [Elusimicrobiota bacterium]